ncbi:MAG: decarboxylating 6-phosphogluconate dehydrogenase [Proteobacteria bacterium]|nr:decarboxylating 6-phosphogluconate dehydrogenase [Pseudomonadota bacterium]
MKIGIVGLGRMGANIARRLMRHGHAPVVHDRNAEATAALAKDGATPAGDVKALLAALPAPRAIWLMLPAGAITGAMIEQMAELLSPGDILIDGGNSHFKETVARGRALAARGIHFIDVGTSGGVWGLERGYCMMIGGNEAAVHHLDPIFAALAPGKGDIEATPQRDGRDPRVEQGYMHCGPSGSGHFAKMVHNGIEYGMMQAYAEGFHILATRNDKALPEAERFNYDVADLAEVWRRGSVVSSWLLDLAAIALAKDGKLAGFTGAVADSGEGRWTVEAAIEQAVPAEVLAAAIFTRFRSRSDNTFAEKLLSALRFEFGGHVEPK